LPTRSSATRSSSSSACCSSPASSRLAEAFIAPPTPTFVDAYDRASSHQLSAAHEPEQQKRYLDQLRALGYIH
jgi:hypothetical protein